MRLRKNKGRVTMNIWLDIIQQTNTQQTHACTRACTQTDQRNRREKNEKEKQQEHNHSPQLKSASLARLDPSLPLHPKYFQSTCTVTAPEQRKKEREATIPKEDNSLFFLLCSLTLHSHSHSTHTHIHTHTHQYPLFQINAQAILSITH